MKKWERFTRQEIEQFVEESSSYAQLAKKIGYSDVSNNGSVYRYVRANELIQKYQIDKFLVGAPSEETTCVNDP